MQSRARLGLSLAPLLAALLVSGCKTAEKQDEVDAGAAPLASIATADPLPSASAAPPVVVPTPTPTPVATTAKLDAGAPSDAGAVAVTDAGTAVLDAGSATSAKLKACSDKCQAVLVGCAIPQIPKDGGLPQIKDPVACQAAANACFAACTP